jgi:integrase/recombinase XerD
VNAETLFERFKAERKALKNVTPKTLVWYKTSWLAFAPYLKGDLDEKQLREALKDGVMAMVTKPKSKTPKKRVAGPVTINNYVRAMNAFYNWLLENEKVEKPFKLAKLKTQTKVRDILTDAEVDRLVAYKPKRSFDKRVYVMVMVILDSGLRLDEARKLKRSDIDFDNRLILVYMGKGRKQRRVPFADTVKRLLWKYCADIADNQFLFTTASGKQLSARNATRDLKRIGEVANVPQVKFHGLRHTMATNYLKRGGNVADLRRILGHTSLNTTMIYEHLQTEDMVGAHQHLSILSARIA